MPFMLANLIPYNLLIVYFQQINYLHCVLLYGEWTFQSAPQLGMFCSGRRDAVADSSASWRAEAPRRPRGHKREVDDPWHRSPLTTL